MSGRRCEVVSDGAWRAASRAASQPSPRTRWAFFANLLCDLIGDSPALATLSRNVRMPRARSVARGEHEGVDLAVDDSEAGDLAASVDAAGRHQLPAGGR